MKRTFATTKIGTIATITLALSSAHCLQSESANPYAGDERLSAAIADMDNKVVTESVAAQGIGDLAGGASMNYAYVARQDADDSVLADVREIVGSNYRRIARKADRQADEVVVEYVGKGKLSAPDAPAEDYHDNVASSTARQKADPDDERAFILFSPQTRNEFRVHLTEAHFQQLAEKRRAKAASEKASAPKAPVEGPGDGIGSDEAAAAMPPTQDAFSTNVDNRARIYGVNSSVAGVNRWMVHFSNTCSGAQVGTSTVITAGHCLWNRGSLGWNSFTLRVGRNGSNVLGNTTSNIKWYLVPPQWQDGSNSDTDPYDIGFVVMSDELDGGTSNGQQYFIPKLISAADLGTLSVWNRGYPACDNFVSNGVSRIDEPCQGLANQTCTVTLGVDTCQAAHVYGDSSSCTIGSFSSPDGDGWNRNYQHSCDASAGQSGSVLYTYFENEWSISAVHFLSLCGKNAADVACTASDVRPHRATRLTPTYLGYYDWLMAAKD